MHKILVPYDFTKIANQALDFAVELSEKSADCAVVLLNVVEHPSASSLKTMGVTDFDPQEDIYFLKLVESVKNKLQTIVDARGNNVSYKLGFGNAYKSIQDEIAAEKVDLLVMGTSGSEGIDEMFVGSNAERVVRLAKCPVITLRAPAKVADIKTIVFASNFADIKEHFGDKVKSLQSIFGAELKVVKINTPANFTSTRIDNKSMSDFASKHGLSNYTIDVYNHANEEDGIMHYAEDIDADMIAIGTNQRTGINHFLLGSIAEDIVNHSKRPVWTMNLEV